MYWTLLYLEYVHSTSLKSSLLKELGKSPGSGLKEYLQGVLGLFKVLWEQVKECLRAFVLWQFLMYLEAWVFCWVGLQVSYGFFAAWVHCAFGAVVSETVIEEKLLEGFDHLLFQSNQVKLKVIALNLETSQNTWRRASVLGNLSVLSRC